MRIHYELAALVFSAWRLANGTERLPLEGNSFDAALERAAALMPERLASGLRFAETIRGRRCLEHEDLLGCGFASFHLAMSGSRVFVTIEAARAMDLLAGLDLSVEQGVEIGRAMRSVPAV